MSYKTDVIFQRSMQRVRGHEGGFQDDSRDRGNWTSGVIGKGELKGTKYGISAMTYPAEDIKNMSFERACELYYRDWWIPLNLNRFPAVLRYQLLDGAIHHGQHSTNRLLQRAVGAVDDGVVGPKTIAAVGSVEPQDLPLLFLAERLDFMTNVKTWPEYGRGWARRIANNMRLAAEDN